MDSTAPGIQYGTALDPDQHDWNTQVPDSPPSSHHMAQIITNPQDLLEKRQLEYWLIAAGRDGIGNTSAATVRIYYPDGSLKEELSMQGAICTDLGSLSTRGTPLDAAVGTGQMTPEGANSTLEKCGRSQVAIFRAVGDLGNGRPGEYQMEWGVVDGTGKPASLTGWFDVLSPAEVVPVPTVTANHTATATPAASATHGPGAAPTQSPVLTATWTTTGTPTVASASAMPTATPVLSLPTRVVTSTITPEPATPKAKLTPTAASPTSTSTRTSTVAPTATTAPTATAVATLKPTAGTPSPTATATPVITSSVLVKWIWELPDMDPTMTGIQYRTAAGQHQHDADMLSAPQSPPFGRGMIQVAPNLEDLPEKRAIEYWLVVEASGSIAEIESSSFRVYYPNGSLKQQTHGQRVACTGLGDKDKYGSPLEAAVHTGQVDATTADLILGNCSSAQWAVYTVTGDLSRAEPWGEYRVEGTIVSRSGATAVGQNWFDVLPTIGLRIDFNRVDFGQIVPNTASWVSGDQNWNPPDDRRPTVKNVGNAEMRVSLQFAQLVGERHGKTIDRFGARLDAEVVDNLPSGTTVCFNHPIAPGGLGRLDLGIRAGSIPSDAYGNGAINIWGSMNCPDQQDALSTAKPIPTSTATSGILPSPTRGWPTATRTDSPTPSAISGSTPSPAVVPSQAATRTSPAFSATPTPRGP